MKDVILSKLIKTAVEGGEEARDAIISLQTSGDDDVFKAATKLAKSKNREERIVGINILGQLGVPTRSHEEASLEFLFDLLAKEEDETVISTIGIALGHIGNVRAIPKLIPFITHSNWEVRYGAVQGLIGHEDETAIQALMDVSADMNEKVRNWAVFGLASQVDYDSESLRDALLRRVEDDNPEVRGEALLGLARRKDTRLLPFLEHELTGEEVGSLAVEAAREIGDSSLGPLLVRLKEWWDVDEELLVEAIEECLGRD